MSQQPDAGQPEVHVTGPAVDVAEAITYLVRGLHHEPDAAGVLKRVVTTATDVLSDIQHAAVTVVHNRKFITAAASDVLPEQVDAIQYATGQGPCLDVLRHEHTFHARDLAAEHRWPDFTRRTISETPIRSMMSFQLLSEADTLGALNLYSTTVGTFDSERLQALCAVFATHAALALSRSLEHDQYLNMQSGHDRARDTNVAVGIMMGQDRLSRTAAFDLLRRRARDQRQGIDELARELIASTEQRHASGETAG